MQELTILALEYVLPSARGLSGDFPKFDLPCLSLLAIIAPLSTVVVLLSCVHIPLKAQLSLGVLPERNSSVSDHAPIITYLSQRFSINPSQQSSSCPIFRSLVIHAHYKAELTFSSLERDFYPYTPLQEKLDRHIPLKITIGDIDEEAEETEEMLESDKHCIISDICCSLPLATVQVLHVTAPELPPAIWKSILGGLDGIRCMMLSNGFMPDLSMLSLVADEPKENPSEQPTRDQGSTTSHMFVPALEELELHDISFIPDDGAHMSLESLFDTLSTRKGLLDQLNMVGCNVELSDDHSS